MKEIQDLEEQIERLEKHLNGNFGRLSVNANREVNTFEFIYTQLYHYLLCQYLHHHLQWNHHYGVNYQ